MKPSLFFLQAALKDCANYFEDVFTFEPCRPDGLDCLDIPLPNLAAGFKIGLF
jgi:hypothetical protein